MGTTSQPHNGKLCSYLLEDKHRYGLIEAIILQQLRYYSKTLGKHNNGIFFRSLPELADDIGLSYSTVRKHLPPESSGWKRRNGRRPSKDGTPGCKTTWWIFDEKSQKNDDTFPPKNNDQSALTGQIQSALSGQIPSALSGQVNLPSQDTLYNLPSQDTLYNLPSQDRLYIIKDYNKEYNKEMTYTEIFHSEPKKSNCENEKNEKQTLRSEQLPSEQFDCSTLRNFPSALTGTSSEAEGFGTVDRTTRNKETNKEPSELPFDCLRSSEGDGSRLGKRGGLTNDPFCVDVKPTPDTGAIHKRATSDRKRRYALQTTLIAELGLSDKVKAGVKLDKVISSRLNQGYSEFDLHTAAKRARALKSSNEIFCNPFFVFSETGIAGILSKNNSEKKGWLNDIDFKHDPYFF